MQVNICENRRNNRPLRSSPRAAFDAALFRDYANLQPFCNEAQDALVRDPVLKKAQGEVKEWPSPSGPKSQPYGMVAAQGAIWYSESAAEPNTVVRFDPKSEKFQSWAIPGGGDIVRNMDVDRDGNPVLANSLVNAVGRVEVKRSAN